MVVVRHLLFPVIIIAVLFLAGCSLHPPVQIEVFPKVDVELSNTPFYPQQQYQCGPAALAMVLQASGVAVEPNDLTPRVYLPGKKGSLQLELIAAIRDNQRIPYVINSEITDIVAELQAGKPILVLQNLGLKALPIFHYAVVVGMQSTGEIVLRSGTTRRLTMDLNDFVLSWKRAGGWAVIVLKPEELPAKLDSARYLKTIAEIETIGNTGLAEAGYRTLLNKYPDHQLALFGLANTLFFRNEFTEAAKIYSNLLNREPTHAAAANNLAESLAGLHCFDEALKLLDTFLRENNQLTNLSTTLTGTRREIHQRKSTSGKHNTDCRLTKNI